MPELPEVETIRRGLDAKLRDARISAVTIREPRLRRPIDAAAMNSLVGRRVRGVGRRGKYLLVDLGEEWFWLIHLGMSGSLVLTKAGGPFRPHEHVRVEVEGCGALVYCDPRRFGLMRVGRAEGFQELQGIGPEPLGNGFGGEVLRQRLRATRRSVKIALLDQGVIAGVGNIYANEILFRAGVRPTRRCSRLRRAEIDRIARAAREVLAEAIEGRGTSFSDYRDSDGAPGAFQQSLAVFDRAGEPCRTCETPVRRRMHGGRSSFFCPRCQV